MSDFMSELASLRYHPQAKRGSYDYTDPDDYVRKDDRAGVTGKYRRQLGGTHAGAWMIWGAGTPRSFGKTAGGRQVKYGKRRRGSGR